jgi:hypothetical protein
LYKAQLIVPHTNRLVNHFIFLSVCPSTQAKKEAKELLKSL